MARVLLVLLALVPAFASQAAEVVVYVARDGDTLHIEASAEIEGSLERAWEVLSDYDHLAQFIPGMRESRAIECRAQGPVVVQKGEARLLFLSYSIEVRLAIEEYPYERIVARAIRGSFKDMRGEYSLQTVEGRVGIRYVGTLVPAFYLPPVIGTFVLRLNAETQFRAIVDEILRRSPRRGFARPASQEERPRDS